MDIQKRFDRILSIFIYLQSKPVVTAKELSERYNVSLRTIYRDVVSLIGAGVPIYGEAGQGYSLVHGYRMPPLQLTREEALSMVAAEKLMGSYTDKNLYRSFQTASQKLKAVLRSAEKEVVADATGSVEVINRVEFNDLVPQVQSALIESIVAKRCVSISYKKPDEDISVLRVIEPVGLFVKSLFWYVMAYCHLRSDYRQFRLDRVKSIQICDEEFRGSHPSLSELISVSHEYETLSVSIRVPKALSRYIHWDRRNYGFVDEVIDGDDVVMKFEHAGSVEAFARWIVMFSDFCKVIEPDVLSMRVREILQEAIKNT